MKIQKNTLILSTLFALVALGVTPQAFAEEIRVTGNTTTSITTENAASITNNKNIQTNVTTLPNVINTAQEHYAAGDGVSNFTQGEVSILTGDIARVTNDTSFAFTKSITIDCHCQTASDIPALPAMPLSGSTPLRSQIHYAGFSSMEHFVRSIFANPQVSTTQNNWLVLALFGNIMLLLHGAYVRLRSGRSPTFAIA